MLASMRRPMNVRTRMSKALRPSQFVTAATLCAAGLLIGIATGWPILSALVAGSLIGSIVNI